MSNYNIVVTDENKNISQALVDFESLKFEFTLNNGTLMDDLVIDGRAGPQVDGIQELSSDILVWRNSDFIYRGRVKSAIDNIGPNRHTTTFSSVDYFKLLQRRILFTDLDYTNVDQSQIAWNLINYTQGLAGGNLGITRGVGQTTGRNRDRNYEAGQNVGELIDNLSNVIDGFDYEVSPELEFNVYYPQRGTQKNSVLEFGGSIDRVTRAVSSSDYANAVRGNGEEDHDENGDPIPAPTIVVESPDIGTTLEGRWDAQVGFPDVKLSSTLEEKANRELEDRSVIRPSYILELREGVWGGFDDFFLGDTVKVVIRTGRINIVEDMRVLKMTVRLDSNGEESVTVEVGQEGPNFTNRILDYETRIRELERR